MNVTACYKLTPRQVKLHQLMLDPNNPRLSLEWCAGKTYSDDHLCSEEVQERVCRCILSRKHRVQRLIDSIGQKGFVRGSQPMIVRRIGRRAHFLVLEGNRRVSAIRNLMSAENDELRPYVLESIRTIPVQVFEYIPNPHYEEEEVVDLLLGTIHIDGPEEWGAMEKAYYIYRSYARELARMRNTKRFRFDIAVAKSVGEDYSMSGGDVRKALGIYRIFHQLRNQKYDVAADDYSLIDMAVSRKVTQEYFAYDTDSLRMSAPGLEQFSIACLEPDSPINNPQQFTAFAYVLKNGTEYEIRQITGERKDPHEIKARTRQRVQKRAFIAKLEGIKQDIEGLRPTDFRGTQEEKRLINQLHRLVEDKLLRLAGHNRKMSA